jgi:hypothetical protein
MCPGFKNVDRIGFSAQAFSDKVYLFERSMATPNWILETSSPPMRSSGNAGPAHVFGVAAKVDGHSREQCVPW